MTPTPNALATWAIDSAIVVGPQNGITPVEGSQMVRVNAAVSTDLYTLVDLSSLTSEIEAQTAVADLTAYFNATASNAASVSLRAFSGNFNFTFNEMLGPQTSEPVFSDDDLTTWEQVRLTGYRIPAGADYLAVGVHAVYDADEPGYIDLVDLAIRIVSPLFITGVEAVEAGPSGSAVEITWVGPTGHVYDVEYTLAGSTNWVGVATNTSGMATNVYTHSAPEATALYRVRGRSAAP